MNDSGKLRKDILAVRNAMEPTALAEKSRRIGERLLALDEVRDVSSIFLYVSFRSEVQTMPLLKELIAMGKTVSVPITYVRERRLDAIQITNPDRDLVAGYCDIPEPHPDILTSNFVAPETIDTIILPGSVFDERCGRFGYGGGFYDRFVSKVPEACRIGLAFDLQVIPKAPLQDHDELLDMVVTESRVIRGAR